MMRGLRGFTIIARKFGFQSSKVVSKRMTSCAAGKTENVIYSDFADCELPRIPLNEYLFDRFDKFGSLTAMECGVTGRKFSYAEVRKKTESFGSALSRMGLRKGDVLGMVLPNCPEWTFVFLGAAGIGVTVSPANPGYTPDEITRQFNACHVKAVLCHHTVGLLLNRTLNRIPTSKHFISAFGHLDGWVNMEDLLKDDGSLYRQAEVDLDNDALILPYSSGTTGLPKGVVLTHNNIVSNLCQYHVPGTTLIQSASLNYQEKYISILPYFHIYGLVVTLLSGLWYGAHITVMPRFEPELFLKTLKSVKPTVLQLVPPLIGFLANFPTVDLSSFERLHTLMSGAAPLGPAVAHKLLDRVNMPQLFLQEGYGMTETSPIAFVSPFENYVIGSCGKPISRTQAKIINLETGISLPQGEEGELCLRGPQIMHGYYMNPTATAETIDDEGWLHTGDIASYDSEGRFFIVDRLKELIKVKGLQVAPSELEDLLRKHPSIIDVAVIGIPDDRSGEVPRAYVVVAPGSTTTPLEIEKFVEEKLSAHKHLKGGVFLVDSIPKSATGKILRRELKADALKSGFRTATRKASVASASAKAAKDQYVVRSPHADCDLPDVSVPSFVFSNMHHPDKVAVECGMTGMKLTYKELYGLSRKFGSALIRMGLKKGDVMGVIIPNSPIFPAVFLGAAAVGVIVSPVNPLYTPDELLRQLNVGQPKAVLSFGPVSQGLSPYRRGIPSATKFITVGGQVEGWINLEDLLKDDGSCFKEAQIEAKDTALLPYSSGTTGLPKGVCITHGNLVASMQQLQLPGMGVLKEATETYQENALGLLPFFHIYGLAVVLLSNLWYGGKITTLPKFDPESFLKTVATKNFSIMQLVPPILSFIANRPEVQTTWLTNLRTAVSGAAPLGTAVANKFLEKVNKPDLLLQEGYGLTETTSIVHVSPVHGSIIGSCGFPFSRTEVKIVDIESGNSLPAGQKGEMWVRGPQVMKGYWNNEEANREAFDDDGWLRTGDIALYNEDKHFFIVDRLKELIKVKGLQVAPNELEDLLRSHPNVLDVAVIGIPDEKSGELPRAYIVKKPGSDVDESQLSSFVAEKVSAHKQLTGGVIFTDAIPKSPTGKILRRVLKEQFSNKPQH